MTSNQDNPYAAPRYEKYTQPINPYGREFWLAGLKALAVTLTIVAIGYFSGQLLSAYVQ